MLWLLIPMGSALLLQDPAVLPSHESRMCCSSISCLSVAQATSLLPLHRALALSLQGNTSK